MENLTQNDQAFWEARERIIPLSTLDDDYTRVLLVGTTGAGKTTIIRQLLGTDPRVERFPTVEPDQRSLEREI